MLLSSILFLQVLPFTKSGVVKLVTKSCPIDIPFSSKQKGGKSSNPTTRSESLSIFPQIGSEFASSECPRYNPLMLKSSDIISPIVLPFGSILRTISLMISPLVVIP